MMSFKSFLVAALVVWLGPEPAFALHRDSPAAVRITTGASHTAPFGRSWNRFLAFTSTQDLSETGSTGKQVFVFSHFAYVCTHPETMLPANRGNCPAVVPPPIVVATSGGGNVANPAVAGTNGNLVVFDADGSYANILTGAAKNHRQIFLSDISTNPPTVRAITDRPDGDSVRPALSSGGGMIAFESTASFNGFPANGVKQVLVYELALNRFWRFPQGSAPSTNVTLNRGGSWLSFESASDLLHDGHDTGVSQVFFIKIIDKDKPQNQRFELHQLTNGDQGSHEPFMAESGQYVVFSSTATNLPGTQAGDDTQVYYGPTQDDNGVAVDLPTITQVTNTTSFGKCTGPVAMDPDKGDPTDNSGARIAFVCSGDPLQNGTTGKRTFVFDTDSTPTAPNGTLYQISKTGDVINTLAPNLGKWFLGIQTNEDLSGTGVCGDQIQVVDFYTGHYQAATQIGQMPVPPNTGDPNAACEDNHACTSDTCNVGAGTCSHFAIPACVEDCPTGSSAQCDDTNDCTTDKCVHFQCQHPNKPNGSTCTDANACTKTDACQVDQGTGVSFCLGSNPVVCPPAQDQCHDAGVCIPASGQCSTPVKQDGTPCDDGNLCTHNDACKIGQCKGTTLSCPADQCHPAGCDANTGQCKVKADGTTCSDGNACTSGETCTSGLCGGGTEKQCDPGGDLCHPSFCNPSSGECAVNVNNCDDQNPCTTDGTCNPQTGQCSPPVTIPNCTTTTTTTTTATTTTKTTTTKTTTTRPSTTTSITATTGTVASTTSTTRPILCLGLVGVPQILCRFDATRAPAACDGNVPSSIASKFSSARGMIEKAGNTSNPKAQKKELKKASKRMRTALGAITKAVKGRTTTIDESCANALRSVVVDIRNRLDTLAF